MARLDPARVESRAGEEHAEDGCPICVAMRGDTPVELSDLFPGDDGSPPRFPEALLLAEAGKMLAGRKVAAGETVSFMEFAKAVSDGCFVEYSFSVDGEGRIFWIGPTSRKLVARLPMSG